VVLGPIGSSTPIDVYTGLTGPSSFGSGGVELANSGSGQIVGVAGSLLTTSEGVPIPILGVPVGYVSGSSLGTSTDTWDDATFASLGVTPGLYTWTWGSGKDKDSFKLVVAGPPASAFAADPPAVPETSTWAMMVIGFAGLGLAGCLSGSKTRPAPRGA
jgi:hypothetical protein